MTLLTICKDAATKIGISQPSYVIGNTQTEVMELLAFVSEEALELGRINNWQALRKEKTFLSLAAEEQSTLPTDFDRFVNETFWNRSVKHPLYGPLTPQEWQYNKSWVSSPVTDSFTVRGKKILINPVPAAGQTMSYEYISKNVILAADLTEKTEFTSDDDTCVLDEHIVKLGAIARFKMSKGLDASTDIAKYDTQLALYKAIETPKKTLKMGSGPFLTFLPNVIVPEGSWGL